MKKYQIIYADPPWDFGGGGESADSVIFDYIAEALTAMKSEPEEEKEGIA